MPFLRLKEQLACLGKEAFFFVERVIVVRDVVAIAAECVGGLDRSAFFGGQSAEGVVEVLGVFLGNALAIVVS